jgi:hypothetical protein
MVTAALDVSFSESSLLAACAPMLEHALGWDQPLTPRTRDELAGDQCGMAPPTLGIPVTRNPRRPDGVSTLPAGLRNHVWQELVFIHRTLIVRGLHNQAIFHKGIVASPEAATQPAGEAGADAESPLGVMRTVHGKTSSSPSASGKGRVDFTRGRLPEYKSGTGALALEEVNDDR